MTLKHINFEDSAVMRSLVKVAHEKGLVKLEPLPVRTAASFVKNDLTPTNNLTENILKLCQGLRSTGLNKYADELEATFVNYKQATIRTLYDTTGEEGEDLIDAAHPQGSHQMKGVEGDALVETIFDRHTKMLDVTNKNPTGKLASSQDVINAVKVALGFNLPQTRIQEGADVKQTIKIKLGAPPTIPLMTMEEQMAQAAGRQVGKSIFSRLFGQIMSRLSAAGATEVGVGMGAGAAVASAVVILSEVIAIYGLGESFIAWGDKAGNISEQGQRVSKEIKDVLDKVNIQDRATLTEVIKSCDALSTATQSFVNSGDNNLSKVKELANYGEKLSQAAMNVGSALIIANKYKDKENIVMQMTFSGFTDITYAASNFTEMADKEIPSIQKVLEQIDKGVAEKTKMNKPATENKNSINPENLKNMFDVLKQRVNKAKEKITDLQWDQARQFKANAWFDKFLVNLKVPEDIFDKAKDKGNVSNSVYEKLQDFDKALSSIEKGIK